MRILITGASGFLGRAVLRELVHGHHQIRVLALPGTERAITRAGAVQIVPGSLQDAAALDRATKGMDVAVHMAGALPGSALAEIWRTNNRRVTWQHATDKTVASVMVDPMQQTADADLANTAWPRAAAAAE